MARESPGLTVALAYVRRSRQSKKRPSASPERQAAAIGEYCTAKGWDADWYRDAEGHRSGKTEVGRPEWLRLKARLESARPGEIAAVVVYALDRSSRNAKDWFTFLDLLQRRQIDFVSVTQPYLDTTTPYGRAMVGSMMIFAQLEVEIDSQRTAEDIEYRQSEGQMWGPSPIGYGLAEKVEGTAFKLKVPDADAPLVVRLLHAYAEGNVSMRQLAAQANLWPAEHVPGGLWRMRQRDGSRVPFDRYNVQGIVANAPIYGGKVIRYNGKDGAETFVGKHAALIDDDLAQRVEQRRLERQNKALVAGRRNGLRPYLLSGLLYCADCGARLRGQMLRDRPRYWHEASHGWARIDADALEADVLARFQGWELPPRVVDELDHHAHVAPIETTDSDAQRRRLQLQLSREKDLYAMGDRNREEYVRRKAEIEVELDRLTPHEPGTPTPWRDLVEVVRHFQALLVGDTSVDAKRMQRSLLSVIVARIETDGERVTMLRLHPWFDALFQGVIELGPRRASSQQLASLLACTDPRQENRTAGHC